MQQSEESWNIGIFNIYFKGVPHFCWTLHIMYIICIYMYIHIWREEDRAEGEEGRERGEGGGGISKVICSMHH